MISTTEQRSGFGRVGAAGGLVLGAQAGAATHRGGAGVIVGAALGAAGGFGVGVGIGIGAFGTMHDPQGNQYDYHANHASMDKPSSAIAFGAPAAVASGAAFFALGAHPSARTMSGTVIAIIGVSMIAAAVAGCTGAPVPDTPASKQSSTSGTPQPLPQHG